jgi:hypothetical protein
MTMAALLHPVGRAMRWPGRQKPGEVWDEAIEWPLGDIDAAEKIRTICRAAADSAEQVALLSGARTSSQEKTHKLESSRYERAAKVAMEIAMKVSDDLMRDAAVRDIVDLCLTAGDLKTARILFRAIQAPSIRDMVLRDHPTLRP